MSSPTSVPPPRELRQLAAVMFTDMVGFSRLMHVDEDEAMRLLDECNVILASAVAFHGGRVLKRMGDAILADFSSATAAVTCAIQIQTRLRDRNAGRRSDEQIRLRIGIHVGDMVIRDGDLFGDGVNVAARLEPLAEPGGVCLSEAVYQALGANASVKPILVGEVELKNILQRQVIYRIPPFYGGDADVGVGAGEGRRSLRLGAVERVDTLPPPSRGPVASVVFGILTGPIAIGLGLLAGIVVGSDPYRIWEWEIADPQAIVTALQTPSTRDQAIVFESLDRDTRAQLLALDPTEAAGGAAAGTIRRLRGALNDLIRVEGPILSDIRSPESIGITDFRRTNRLRLEATFPESIQRYISEPPAARILARMLAHWWTYEPAWILGLIAFDVALGLTTAYLITLITLRVSFRDIRDVDALLDYYVRDFGFHPPRRSGDSLVFRATFWTFSVYNVLQLEARVSGNTVLLTGPAPVMRRLKKRMLLLADPAAPPA